MSKVGERAYEPLKFSEVMEYSARHRQRRQGRKVFSKHVEAQWMNWITIELYGFERQTVNELKVFGEVEGERVDIRLYPVFAQV